MIERVFGSDVDYAMLNSSARTMMRRYTRLSNGFSRKLRNTKRRSI
jgi:hypothetical protein